MLENLLFAVNLLMFLVLLLTELTLTGSPSAIEAAREIIESLNAPRQRRERDDY